MKDQGNDYKIGDKIQFKIRVIWSGYNIHEGVITAIEHDEDMGVIYTTDCKHNNGVPMTCFERNIIKKLN